LASIKALVGRHFGELLAIPFSGYLVHNKMAMLVSAYATNGASNNRTQMKQVNWYQNKTNDEANTVIGQ
jgi:hypothetical protein